MDTLLSTVFVQKSVRTGQDECASSEYLSAMDKIGPTKPFRHFIREWMEHKDINQERLAGRLESEASTVSKLLNGRMRLSDIWISRIAWALDVDVQDLFRHPKAPTQAELLLGLTDEQKTTVLNLIEVFKKAG